MKREVYSYPKSSFLSIQKDVDLIITKILKNENLKKMLYYTSRDCLSRPKLTEDETFELFEKNIKFCPKVYVDDTLLNYLIINFDKFAPTENPEFRSNIIEFDIICNNELWQMDDFALRPYRIAAELDSMFDNQHLTGIGELEFVKASQLLISNDYAGVCLKYRAVHGGEDKKKMPNPKDEAVFEENFNQIFNEEE